MKVLHPIENRWIDTEGHTVKQIVDELNLPDTSEGCKWSAKVNGSLQHSGNIPDNSIVELVEYNSANDLETVQPPEVQSTGGDNDTK